tara:strand:- start:7951 stop:8139 length:189 start_codon:yes stop_codon:yes gene_type:complete
MTELAPTSVRETIARNLLRKPKWVVIDISALPPVAVSRGDITHPEWIEAFRVLQDHAEKSMQ